jgi:transcriptional regulator with XRE-family HTH domain
MQRKPKLWTKTGLSRLGELIRSCRKSQKLSSEEAAALIYTQTGEAIASRTLLSVETAIGKPEYNTLAIIAASGIATKNGRILDIYDFINIAAESEAETMNPLWRLIENHFVLNQITLGEFADASGVEMRDLEAIAQGRQTEDYEGDLILISSQITNPATGRKFASYMEMLAHCGIENTVAESGRDLVENGKEC